mmetsp:Transcript_10353/g.21897  ORF Transcript_10353/g.21897 Transcript_10353/m.21897 type:complete len:128 (-) Transcript_10353:240-623(-)
MPTVMPSGGNWRVLTSCAIGRETFAPPAAGAPDGGSAPSDEAASCDGGRDAVSCAPWGAAVELIVVSTRIYAASRRNSTVLRELKPLTALCPSEDGNDNRERSLKWFYSSLDSSTRVADCALHRALP